jgi:hypothetical protein
MNDIQHNAFSAIMLSIVMLNVVMLSVIMLNVVMLSVVAPNRGLFHEFFTTIINSAK